MPARARLSFLLLGATTLLAACAAPTAGPGAGPASPAVAPAGTTVPDLVGRDVGQVGKAAAGAGVVAVVEYQAGAPRTAGTVVSTRPAAGAPVERGSTVAVVVAGKPGEGLDDRIAADRDRFVGLGVDGDGTLVVAVTPGTDPEAAIVTLRPALEGRRYRVVSCDRTRTELEKVQVAVTGTDLRATGYGVRLDPAACAIRIEGDLPADVATALTARHGRAVVVVRGAPARRL